jgi:hypothetical protein
VDGFHVLGKYSRNIVEIPAAAGRLREKIKGNAMEIE